MQNKSSISFCNVKKHKGVQRFENKRNKTSFVQTACRPLGYDLTPKLEPHWIPRMTLKVFQREQFHKNSTRMTDRSRKREGNKGRKGKKKRLKGLPLFWCQIDSQHKEGFNCFCRGLCVSSTDSATTPHNHATFVYEPSRKYNNNKFYLDGSFILEPLYELAELIKLTCK